MTNVVFPALSMRMKARCAQRPLKRQKQAAAEAAFQYSPARKVGVR
jgi:hypothetical protein